LRKAQIGSLDGAEKSSIVYSRPTGEIGWREIFEDKVNLTDSEEIRKKILNKNSEYGICHFCKKIELNTKLNVCMYNSSKNGFPECHTNNIDPLVVSIESKVR
jgi:hypothetical protein